MQYLQFLYTVKLNANIEYFCSDKPHVPLKMLSKSVKRYSSKNYSMAKFTQNLQFSIKSFRSITNL